MLNVLKKIDKSIEWVQLVMCCIIMFAIMWLTFAMVFWRYALNNSIVWAEEILRYIMIWGVLVGAGLTTREDQHVSMDILQGAFARWPKLRAAHYLITRIIVFGFMIYLIGPSLELIERAGNSTATSVVWLPKSVIYASFVAGIISVNLSLLGQVPRKVYNIIHGIESDELLLEAQAMAKEFDRELEAEAAKDSDDNADNVVDNRRRQNDRTHFTLKLTHFLQRFHGYAHARRRQNYADKHRVEHKRLVRSQCGKTAQKRHGEQKSAGNRHQHAAESNESRLQPRTFQLFYVGFEPCREQNQYYADFRDAF